MNVVISGDATLDVHNLAANLLSLRLLHVSLFLVHFPVRERKHLKMLEYIDKGVLPDRLNDGYIRRVGLVCRFFLS